MKWHTAALPRDFLRNEQKDIGSLCNLDKCFGKAQVTITSGCAQLPRNAGREINKFFFSTRRTQISRGKINVSVPLRKCSTCYFFCGACDGKNILCADQRFSYMSQADTCAKCGFGEFEMLRNPVRNSFTTSGDRFRA